jgi:hypothetical protein
LGRSAPRLHSSGHLGVTGLLLRLIYLNSPFAMDSTARAFIHDSFFIPIGAGAPLYRAYWQKVVTLFLDKELLNPQLARPLLSWKHLVIPSTVEFASMPRSPSKPVPVHLPRSVSLEDYHGVVICPE